MNFFNRKLLSVLFTISLGSLKFMYDYGIEVGKQQANQQIEAYIEKIDSLQDRLKKQREQVNTKIVIEYKTKTKTIVKKEKEYVHEATILVPDQYTLSSGWVYLHDAAATEQYANPTLSSNATSSGVEANTALATIVENYGICEQNAEQLRELQKWVIDNENLVTQSNQNK